MVGEALARHALDRGLRPVNVAAPEPDPVIIAEVKFREITMQVLFLAVLIDTLHAAFENRECAFDGICVHVATGLFLDRVLHGFMGGEMPIRAVLEAAFVGEQPSFLGDVVGDDPSHRILVSMSDME